MKRNLDNAAQDAPSLEVVTETIGREQATAGPQRQEPPERLAEQVKISTEVAQEIASVPALAELYRRVVTLVKERFGYYHVQIFRLDPDLNAMVVVEGDGEVGERMKAAGHSRPYGQGMVGTAAATGQPMLAPDVSENPHWVTSLYLPDTKGELVVPIKLRDQVLGVLDIQSDVAGALTTEDQVLLMGLAGQIAVAIQNTNLLAQSQAALAKAQESERLLRTVIDATPDWIFIKDQEHRYVLVNEGYARSLRLEPEDFIGKNDLQLGFSEEQVKGNPEKGISGFWTHDQRVMESGETLVYRGDPVVVNGQTRYFHSIKTPVRDAEGRIWGVLGFARDITEREQLLAEVQKSEGLLRTIIDSTPDWIYVKDQQYRFLLVNRSFAHAYGLDMDEVIGKDNLDLGWPEDMCRGNAAKGIRGIWEDDQEVMDSGRTKVIPRQAAPLESGVRLFETTKAPLFDAEGHVWGMVGFSRDVTEHARLLNDIQQSEQLLRGILDATPDWIFVKDREHRYRLANKGYADALHIQVDDFYGKTDLELGFPEELVLGDPDKGIRGFWADDRLVMNSGERQIYPRDPATIDGQIHIFHTIKMPLRDAEDKIWGVLAFARDVTEREQLVAELERRAEQLQLAAEASRLARQEAETAGAALAAQMWHTSGQAQLGDRLRGEQDVRTLAQNVIQHLCCYVDAQVGVLYTAGDGLLTAAGSYAFAPPPNWPGRFKLGEGLVGQAALEKRTIVVRSSSDGHLTLATGLGQLVLRNVVVLPYLYADELGGAVELGALNDFTPAQIEFLEMAMVTVGIAFNTARARGRIDELLAKTQHQAEEMQAQSEELRVANEELQSQTESLRRSEAALREKQGQLEEANAELEARTAALEQQQGILDRQNRELTLAQADLEQKARELAQASKYKSEFLANMSHELRTPLNSLLILAGMLQQNEAGNLTADQVESLEVIHHSGRDLLALINDILDLSKIEAGRMTFHFEPTALQDVVQAMEAQFAHVAQEKGLAFEVTLAPDLPVTIDTDRQRVYQILKNLLSNAFKFTERGSVGLAVYRPATLPEPFAAAPDQVVALRVTDTGIGIAPEQQQIVFEAFQQAEGGTSRKFGGTGLGLSISRELSLRLSGYLGLDSELSKGSTFTLYLPQNRVAAEQRTDLPVSAMPSTAEPAGQAGPSLKEESLAPAPVPDDRDDLDHGDKILLVVEDDAGFARVVRDLARKKGFKCLVAGDGESGLALAGIFHPDAIILDLNLPRLSGWEVLGRLKESPDTRHIPVHIMSVEAETLDAYKRGAMGFLSKPLSGEDLEEAFQQIEGFIERAIKSLLLVEDDANLRRSISKLLSGSDVRISEAGTGQAALDLLRTQHFDCMILDLSLPDISGFEVMNRMDGEEAVTKCPVIVYTGRELTPEENLELLRYTDSVIVKGVKSPERLLDETALFLHRVVADLPEDKQQTIRRLHDKEAQLAGKEILIVDDDARSAFALSRLLADKGMKVSIARDGQQALDLLARTPEVDLVLMDVMMPVMDGYETTRRIRAQERFAGLPILALTAKAMAGDREKCLEAGANDYLPKPIDAERLFSVLRVWLYQ